jgi:hypothetical protein
MVVILKSILPLTGPNSSPNMNPSGPTGTHAWISFSYSDKKGPYMTVYLAPRVLEAYEASVGGKVADKGRSWHPAHQEGGQNQNYHNRTS